MDDEAKIKARSLMANRIFAVALDGKYTPAQRLLHTEAMLDIWGDIMAKEAINTIKVILYAKAPPVEKDPADEPV